MQRQFVVGDIHGGYRGFQQVCERSRIDPKKDRLICLGDVCDGWPETPEAFEALFEFEDLIYTLGNHDIWTMMWMDGTIGELQFQAWYSQGGAATIEAYERRPELTEKHHRFLKEKGRRYFLDGEGRLYLHGGFDTEHPIDQQPDPRAYHWDRSLQEKAWEHRDEDLRLGGFPRIFIGHTQTVIRGSDQPLFNANVVCMDTGATSMGPLTLMDCDSLKYWQSDPVRTLYPGHEGR